jgi:protein-tyrosine phosphatase
MAEVHDWQTVADPDAVIRQALGVLRGGGLVALPTETGYGLAASGLAPEAVGPLRELGGEPVLAVRGAAEALDWAPGLTGPGQRLAKRLWPGPLTLACAGAAGQGLAARLPAEVRSYLADEGGALRLRTPAHEAVLEVLRRLPGPLVLAPVRTPDAAVPGAGAGDAGQVVRAVDGRASLVIDDGPSRFSQPCTVVRVDGATWQVERPGLLPEELLRRQASCLVVFVCTGNTCRSPMAEALFKKRLADRLGCGVDELPARGFCVLSAGMAAMMGEAAASEAVEVARAFGADLAGHRSQPMTAELAAQADYLLAMTRSHVRALEEHFPRLGAVPRLLNPAGDDVADPVGCDHPVYAACGQQIWQHLAALVEELRPGQGQGQT